MPLSLVTVFAVSLLSSVPGSDSDAPVDLLERALTARYPSAAAELQKPETARRYFLEAPRELFVFARQDNRVLFDARADRTRAIRRGEALLLIDGDGRYALTVEGYRVRVNGDARRYLSAEPVAGSPTPRTLAAPRQWSANSFLRLISEDDSRAVRFFAR